MIRLVKLIERQQQTKATVHTTSPKLDYKKVEVRITFSGLMRLE